MFSKYFMWGAVGSSSNGNGDGGLIWHPFLGQGFSPEGEVIPIRLCSYKLFQFALNWRVLYCKAQQLSDNTTVGHFEDYGRCSQRPRWPWKYFKHNKNNPCINHKIFEHCPSFITRWLCPSVPLSPQRVWYRIGIVWSSMATLTYSEYFLNLPPLGMETGTLMLIENCHQSWPSLCNM